MNYLLRAACLFILLPAIFAADSVVAAAAPSSAAPQSDDLVEKIRKQGGLLANKETEAAVKLATAKRVRAEQLRIRELHSSRGVYGGNPWVLTHFDTVAGKLEADAAAANKAANAMRDRGVYPAAVDPAKVDTLRRSLRMKLPAQEKLDEQQRRTAAAMAEAVNSDRLDSRVFGKRMKAWADAAEVVEETKYRLSLLGDAQVGGATSK